MSKLLVSPKGSALWAHLFTPDTYLDQTKFKVNLVLPADDPTTHDFIETLERLRDEWWSENGEEKFPNAAKRNKMQPADVCEPEADKDGAETGNLVFKFSSKASITDRNGNEIEIRPQIFDGFKKPITSDPGVGNGSTIKVAFKPVPYGMAATGKYGVSLRLVGVQIIELKEYQGGGSVASMFDEEDSSPGFTDEDAPF